VSAVNIEPRRAGGMGTALLAQQQAGEEPSEVVPLLGAPPIISEGERKSSWARRKRRDPEGITPRGLALKKNR
jgi:hypothetical protein